MRYRFLLLTIILSLSVLFAACGGDTAVNNSANNKPANANTAVVVNNSTNSLATTKKPEAETTNNAPTLAPVVAAYYEALKKKDDAGIRKVFSQNSIKSLEADMKADKKTSLAAFLAELETNLDKPFEARNEKIDGETAVVEMRGGSLGVWTPIDFVRENGEWKMSNGSSDVRDVKKSASESNMAK